MCTEIERRREGEEQNENKKAEKADRKDARDEKAAWKACDMWNVLKRHVSCAGGFNIFYLPSLWSCLETRFLRQN